MHVKAAPAAAATTTTSV